MNTPATFLSPPPEQPTLDFSFDRDNPGVAAILQHVSDGRCCQVLGPRHHLKSRLVQFAGNLLTGFGTHHVVYLDLEKVDRGTNFFANLDALTRAALPLSPGEHYEECRSATDFQLSLGQLASGGDRNLLLVVDHLEIAPPNLVASLLGALRSAHTARIDDKYGNRFQALVCGSLLLSQVALRNADRFEHISQTVMVPDLSREESIRLLNASLARGLTITDEAADTLLNWIDGDALLIAEAATLLNRLDGSGRTVIEQDDVATTIPAIGFQNPAIEEILRHIDSEVRLLTVVRRLLEHASVPAEIMDSQETRTLLDLCGVVTRRDGVFQIKSAAWERLLRARLNAGYVGRLFARAGDWRQAIRYLGQAQSNRTEAEQDYRPELFATIINAIHDSRDMRGAFDVLEKGLRAAYPDQQRTVLLYAVDPNERAFKLITPVERQHSLPRPRIGLSQGDRPEVQACSGTEYSISVVDGETRLLYPLRSSAAGSDPLGLVSADESARPGLIYQSWEERKVLLGFLRNIARALASKQRFRDLLSATSQRAELLRVLDQIKTLLHAPELSEETVWRVMLEGVTHGRGLSFNRAILFTPDGPGRLVARYAIGHADRVTTEDDWKRHPFTQEATDDWIAGLVERHRQPPQVLGPLERSLHGLTVALGKDNSLLKRCFEEQELIHGFPRSGWGQSALPETLTRTIHPADEFLLVPLRGAREALGALYVDNKFSNPRISGEASGMLRNFADQIALVVEGARALATERQLRRLEQVQRVQNVQMLQRLVASALRLTRDEPLNATLHHIVQEAMEVLDGVSAVTLYSIDEQDDVVLAACEGVRYRDKMKTHPPFNKTRVERIVKDGMEFFVTNVSEEPTFRHSAFVKREGICSMVALPLAAGGRQLGVIFFSYCQHHLFPDGERSALSLFAQLAAAEILYDRLDRELKKMTELEQYIVQGTLGNEFIHRLNGTIAGMLDHVDEIGDLVGVDVGIRELLDLLRMKVNGLGKLSADIQQRLKEVMREAKREPRELGPFIEQVIEQLKWEAPKNVAMFFHSQLPIFSYPIDSFFFEELLQHLVRNAWEAIPDNRDGRVDVTLERVDNWIRIAVRDNGRGIDEDKRRRVFERAYSTRSGDRGQGLPISKWIAKLHGGHLSLGPSDSKGTAFYFDLPGTPE